MCYRNVKLDKIGKDIVSLILIIFILDNNSQADWHILSFTIPVNQMYNYRKINIVCCIVIFPVPS